MGSNQVTVQEAKERLRRLEHLRLWLVWSSVISGGIAGLVFGSMIEKPLAGVSIGVAVGWFVSWVIGIAFEENEYPLFDIIFRGEVCVRGMRYRRCGRPARKR